MSQQQAVVAIFSVVVITVMIWVGFGFFLDSHRMNQKDEFLVAMNNIGASALAFRQKPGTMGGGGGKYIGFEIPRQLTKIDAGTIFAVVEPQRIFIVGHSSRGYGSVSGVIEESGRLTHVSLEGEFSQ